MSMSVRNNSFQLNFSCGQQALSPAQAQVTQQVLQTLMGDIAAVAPQLANDVAGLLAMQGRALPSSSFQGGDNPFAAFSAMDPRAAMAGVGQFRHELPADNYQSRAEALQNLDQTYGPGTANLALRAESSMQGAQLGLVAALHGASKQDIVNLLGADNPHSGAVATRLQALAKELTRVPPDMQKLSRAAQRADWSLLHHATPGDPVGRARLKKVFQSEYGISRPGARPYNGGGNFGNQVAQAAPGLGGQGVPPPVGSGAGERALNMARSQLGVREATGNNDGLPSQRYMNGRREPWCANFVAWSFRQTGNPLPGNQRSLASVQYMEDQMKAKNKWFRRGAAQPKPGDVIFFANRGASDKGPGRHVGIVEKVENGRVYTVEGNSGNGVKRRSYSVNDPRISGYGRN